MWNIYEGSVPSDARTPAPTLASVTDIFSAVDDGPLAWQERALCAQTDPEAFFPEKGGSTREAKKVCTSCDVRSQCLDYALANDERFGIWGGLSERERRKLKRRAVVVQQPQVLCVVRGGRREDGLDGLAVTGLRGDGHHLGLQASWQPHARVTHCGNDQRVRRESLRGYGVKYGTEVT